MAGNVPLRASNKWDGRKRKAVEMGDIFLEMRGRVISSKWSYGLLIVFGPQSAGADLAVRKHPMKHVEVSVEFPRPTNLCLSLTGNLAQPKTGPAGIWFGRFLSIDDQIIYQMI